MKRVFGFGFALLIVFSVFTWSLTFIDVKPIGPDGSHVGYASLNEKAHMLTGVHWTLYFITDWAGAAVILIPVGFAFLGLCQWIKRKQIRKVDPDLRFLGGFYLFVFGAYIFFEHVVINRRPVLIDGYLEASYPSSTTVLSLCVLITAMMQAQIRITHPVIRNFIRVFLGISAFFIVTGRLLSGVHWFTDIIGGVLFSAGAAVLYTSAIQRKK